MSDSILQTIKKMLGLDEGYTAFDQDIIVFINAALMSLNQLGVGPEGGLSIKDYTTTWSNLLTDEVNLNGVQQYVYLKVKMIFDPPGNSFVMDAFKQQAQELEWRLNVQSESVKEFDFMQIPNDYPRVD